MLDQIKIGLFISNTRKELGLTQRQLAEKIGVSDKAVSKWENGRGIPDTSLFDDLCSTLGININELLSGERLSEDIYIRKAEDNMIELIREKEDLKKEKSGAIVGTIAGVILLGLFIYSLALISGNRFHIIYFVDMPSLFAVLGLTLIILGASGWLGCFFRGFKLLFAEKNIDIDKMSAIAEESEYAVALGIKSCLLAGGLASVIGITFSLFAINDLSKLGPNLAVAILTLFYAILISLFLCIVKGRLHKRYNCK